MFLALNEIFHEKARFILIITIIAMISFLTYFLTALAYGLATSYTQGIDKWGAEGIMLEKDVNSNIARSLLAAKDFDELDVASDSKAKIGASNATLTGEEKTDVALFGIDTSSFIAPNITEGEMISSSNEVVVSDELKASDNLKLGDTLSIKATDLRYKIVGFTDHATFQTSPLVYLQLPEWRTLTADISGMTGMVDEEAYNAIVVTQQPTLPSDSDVTYETIRDFSFALPGYSAQVATFSFMIGFLIFIASFVLAIFTYILTIQKKGIFGILKAEGVPTSYISRSVVVQVLILTLTGIVLGLAGTIGFGLALGTKIPFMVQPLFFGAISVLFVVCALIGALASVRIVTKIDPVEAIG